MHEGGAGCRCGECQRLTVGISGWCPTWPQFKKYNHHKLKSYKPYIISSVMGSGSILFTFFSVFDRLYLSVGVHVCLHILFSFHQTIEIFFFIFSINIQNLNHKIKEGFKKKNSGNFPIILHIKTLFRTHISNKQKIFIPTF